MALVRVVVVAYEGVQSLDVIGPVEVFDKAGGYRIEVVSPGGRAVTTTSGLRLGVDGALERLRGPIDTLVVAGGDVRHAVADVAVVAAVRRLAGCARRVTSVCSGAFLLAECGLLDGRRATTHWAWCDVLAESYPAVEVDPEPIFVRDGPVLTSAGVTAGMDLALAVVEEDHGPERALAVARHLVMYVQRPGGQAQFSTALRGQRAERAPLREVQAWMAEHLDDDLSVGALARRAAMSPRHFARAFAAEAGVTPARFVEDLRVDAARRLLEGTGRPVETVAAECGFGSPETMRRAFLRSVRVTPSDYRKRFCKEPA